MSMNFIHPRASESMSKIAIFMKKFEDSAMPEKYRKILKQFLESYLKALEEAGEESENLLGVFTQFISFVGEQLERPYVFAPFHQAIRFPIDYYQFGVDFLSPLVDFSKSTIEGKSNLTRIKEQLAARENVILFANHQTEGDPQFMSLLLDKEKDVFAENTIFVAGDRVVTDPLAAPFSMGRNLLCIYSKRYIDHPPEDRLKKQFHNRKTMEIMSDLLAEGGHCIYIAPSGGRDRANETGQVEIARFDPQSIEMCFLMAKKAGIPTHFYPFTLSTYFRLPPPQTVQVELGEVRKTSFGPIHFSFGDEIDVAQITAVDKHETRQKRADAFWNVVHQTYMKWRDQGIADV